MWIPESEEELLEQVISGSVEETSILEFKESVTENNTEIAKDIAAMTTDGGIIIYGVGEDENNRPTVLSPVPLKGLPERIHQISRSRIAEPPSFEIKSIVSAHDAERGYLVVVVPASHRAPHMVVVKSENRYYGRNGPTNVVLGEGDVARLYERRHRWEVDARDLLERVVTAAPVAPHDEFGYLHLLARPVAADDDRLEKALGSKPEASLSDILLGIRPACSEAGWHPSMRLELDSNPIRRSLNGWTISDRSSRTRGDMSTVPTLEIQFRYSGEIRLFWKEAAKKTRGSLRLQETKVADVIMQFLILARLPCDRSRYVGPLDIGVAVTGIAGAISTRSVSREEDHSVGESDFLHTVRALPSHLKSDAWAVADELSGRFFRAISLEPYEPFNR